MTNAERPTFPLDPLDKVVVTREDRRRTICGILESYHGTHDVLIESVQNAFDAVEDAILAGLPEPYLIRIEINIQENWFSVLDTGIGMTWDQVTRAFAPNVSFKDDPTQLAKRKVWAYRGYKGVGLTFVAYGTDDVTLHSRQQGVLVKSRMQYGRSWANGTKSDPALIVEDNRPSPLEKQDRGTYIRVQFSQVTRPKQLGRVAGSLGAWAGILRTRTAIGQVLIGQLGPDKLRVELIIQDAQDIRKCDLQPTFLYPHLVIRKPEFRFLDLVQYFAKHTEQSTPPPDKLRQDGIFMEWDTAKISQELTESQRKEYDEGLKRHTPRLYAFVPYQASIWMDMNEILTGTKNRPLLHPGLILAVNRQRLAEKFDIDASRFTTFSQNVMVIVHLDNAKPDQGRKTLDDDAIGLAQKAADRAVQYLAKQRGLLKPAGDAPTPEQRQVEKSFDDWVYNVRKHQETNPLHIPPVTYLSAPLAEQDVVGLFHQLSALGVFPGLQIYATSQTKTYDCLVRFHCSRDTPGLLYKSIDNNPLGVSPYILGEVDDFSTKNLTLEFKNNLDGLISELGGESAKSYRHIDICVCWSTVADNFPGYEVEEIVETSIDQRKFPGITHLLRRDGDPHVIQLILLERISQMINAGQLQLVTK